MLPGDICVPKNTDTFFHIYRNEPQYKIKRHKRGSHYEHVYKIGKPEIDRFYMIILYDVKSGYIVTTNTGVTGFVFENEVKRFLLCNNGFLCIIHI